MDPQKKELLLTWLGANLFFYIPLTYGKFERQEPLLPSLREGKIVFLISNIFFLSYLLVIQSQKYIEKLESKD